MEDFQLCGWSVASMFRSDLAAVHEAVARHPFPVRITTCQRIEVLDSGGPGCPIDDGHIHRRGLDALRHLAEVAAGLHSVILGEPQVLGQVRAGLADAPPEWGRYTGAALAAARELRRREHFASHSGHLLDRGLATLEMRPSGRLLVLGAGPMGRLVAARGLELGFSEVLVGSRTRPVTSLSGAMYVPLDTVASIAPVQVVVGCLGESAPELGPGHLPSADALIDLGTPRNFADQGNTPVVTLRHLLDVQDGDAATRRRELASRLAVLLARRLEMASRDAASSIGMLRQELERVRRQEVSRIRKLHPEITAEAAEAITLSLVNKLFHLPVERLRQVDDGALRDRLVELFLRDEADHGNVGGHQPERTPAPVGAPR